MKRDEQESSKGGKTTTLQLALQRAEGYVRAKVPFLKPQPTIIVVRRSVIDVVKSIWIARREEQRHREEEDE